MSALLAKLSSPKPGSIELHEFDGKHFRLRSPDPFAPGQPLTVTIAAPLAR